MRRAICFVTGSRAEYGLLKPLIDLFKDDERFRFALIVTGSHLSRAHGLTYREIEKDGVPITRKINLRLSSDTPAGIGRSLGITLARMAKTLPAVRPDLLVVLGDRFEIFAAVSAALIARVPVAHIHGGELTAGAYDDSLRHCITKMSHLHFTATEAYRQRVIQLGERPDCVYNVGALGLDNIRTMAFQSKAEVERFLGRPLMDKNLLITHHSETLAGPASLDNCRQLLSALDALPDTLCIFTKPNADTGNRSISDSIEEFVRRHPENAVSCVSLGRVRYLSVMKFVDAVVGNSSSGIIEAPSLGVGTLNIGDRQRGRLRADSVIDCPGERSAILRAFAHIFSAEYKRALPSIRNPYGDGHTAGRIKELIMENISRVNVKKGFYDLSETG